jgi:ADP-heptose:LPS heptosyltransferase
VILTGSSSERPMIERVAELMHERPVLLCGLIDLQQMPALLERSSLYVGNDTGPMHIAAAVGTPTISIFSARDFPQRWHPAGPGHTVLRHDAPCSPCFREVCNREPACIEEIKVEDVLSAVRQQLFPSQFPLLAGK